MRLLLGFCRACGSDRVVIHAKERKDAHGHMVQFSEWATCEGCGITEMTTPWTEHECPVSTAKPT